MTPLGNWRGKYLDSGPPRGPGHHAEDGRSWWDDDQQRWFRVTDQEEVREIEAEDMGGTSLAASVLTTLSSQYGNGYFRFVARVRSADPRWPTYAMAGATFPAPGRRWRTSEPRAPGSRISGSGSRSCTNSCWPRAGGRPATAPTGGWPATGGRTWTGTPQPTPSQQPATELTADRTWSCRRATCSATQPGTRLAVPILATGRQHRAQGTIALVIITGSVGAGLDPSRHTAKRSAGGAPPAVASRTRPRQPAEARRAGEAQPSTSARRCGPPGRRGRVGVRTG